ncbi:MULTISPECIES: FUSC family protein [unclassified Nostoc]|uniref:FUSC family protein n=1 Tax=unclassified Nostoc TaxID=2593658 RepID=UPI002AD252ED|nr:FUSC family protein [Nostoc sp. DedQUE03]MDZ7972322.1 FUSC family membrane protein [Nostoc sp. DedQUE03]MDZ8047191.1 FUSC family membrane protein [Nostoc sp. DedQUE02]
MSFTDKRPLSWLLQQFQLQPGKPAIASGLRSLFILGVPIGIGIITGHAAESAIATMAAWFVGMVNVDGAYRQRAIAMIAATIGVTVMFLIASLVSSHLWLAVPTTFLVIFIAGLANLYGNVAASVSLVTSIMFVIALARFASFSNLPTLIQHCGLCLAGGTWTTVLSLGLWAVRPDIPAIQTVANCYLSLSNFVDLASQRASNPKNQQEWEQRFLQAQDTVIQNLISARSVWTTIWTRQRGATLRGNQLLVLIEDINQIVNSVVALSELLAIASEHQLFSRLQPEIQQVLEQSAIALQMLSQAIAKGKNSPHLGDLDRSLEALEHQRQVLRSQILNQTINAHTNEYSDLLNLGKITASLTKLVEQIHTDAEIVTDLSQGKLRNSIAQRDISPPAQPERSTIIDTLRNNFTFDSVLFRHALRLALITTLAELLASLFQLPRGYWITLTALVALKPNFGGTSQTTVQRVVGTILGGIIGIVLVLLVKNSLASAVCFLLLVFVAMSVRSLSYSLFIILLTPAIILLLNMISAGGWEVGVLRIFDSLAGGVLALLGSYLLFPSWERQQLPAQLEKTIRANLTYFQQVIANYLHPEQNAIADINILRHQAALENANANAAAQRLFSEPRHIQGEIEPVMTLIIYIRGFFGSVTTLAEHLREFSGEYQFPELKRLADTIVQVLENLADALGREQPPQPLPALDSYLEAIHAQIEQLHTARLSEIATNSNTLTPTLQAVQEQTPLSTELDRIVNEIKVMHCVIARLQE